MKNSKPVLKLKQVPPTESHSSVQITTKLSMSSNDVIDLIGENAGLQMWHKRDKSKTYSYPGSRDDESDDADDYVNGEIVKYDEGPFLLCYKQEGVYYGDCVYVINLNTMKPTQKSCIQTPIPDHLKKYLKELIA